MGGVPPLCKGRWIFTAGEKAEGLFVVSYADRRRLQSPTALWAEPPLGKGAFARFELISSYASMVDTLMVISSSTSSTMRTVSKLENRVTPFSTAQRRMYSPSAI